MKAKRTTGIYQSKMKRKNNKAGYLFLSPMLLLFCGLFGYSMVFLIKNSLYRVTISFKDIEYLGMKNYLTVVKDFNFWGALFHTFLLAGANILCGLTLGFLIAVFLNFKIFGKRFFHALFFIPSMLPMALMAAVFNSILQYKEGILNQILRKLHLDFLCQRWLADPGLAMISVMSVSIFLIGIPIMYYTADMTVISKSVLEAASIDGAKFRHILTMILYPMLKNTHKTIILSMLLGSFREMDRVFMMTDGGPGGATEIIGTWIYRFTRAPGSNLGKVCAASVIVILISFSIGFVQLRIRNKS